MKKAQLSYFKQVLPPVNADIKVNEKYYYHRVPKLNHEKLISQGSKAKWGDSSSGKGSSKSSIYTVD